MDVFCAEVFSTSYRLTYLSHNNVFGNKVELELNVLLLLHVLCGNIL